MEAHKKCSSKKHANIDAISYCQECNKYMWNKCKNMHNELFEDHHKYNINENINKLFTGICKEPNHKNELEFYWKIIIYYVALIVFQKLKKKDMVNILNVIFA